MIYHTNQSFSALLDVQGVCPQLYNYAFFSSTGTATITGFFVGELGVQVGLPSYSGTVTATPVTLIAALGISALPPGAAGFVGQLSGQALSFSLCVPPAPGNQPPVTGTIPTANHNDMVANPTRYPQFPISSYFFLGRVN